MELTELPIVSVRNSPAEAAPESAPEDAAEEQLSFDEVYDRYFDDMWRALRRLGVPEMSAEDAAQDVFVIVHRRLSEFEGRSQLRTWIYGVALNVARSYRRKLARARSSVDTLSASESTPDRDAAQTQALQIVDETLQAMDVEKREMFVLKEIEELTAPEIASILDLKLPTVYTRIRAARIQFTDLLRQRRREGGLS
jgi:RNA polymerase sigma-70 factor (ECF subfamily)